MTTPEPADLPQLADHVRSLVAASGRRVIIGIVGAPGTGKSTFAEQLHQEFAPGASVIVPMDGFHLSNRVIAGTPLQARKGAIDTMDAGGYVSLIERLRARDETTVFAPAYLRGLEEPIAASIPIPATVDVVLTEGNYLLSDAAPWSRIRDLIDDAWYIEVPRELHMARLIQRHVDFGMPPDDALNWATGPDEENTRLIEQTRDRADRIIAWS